MHGKSPPRRGFLSAQSRHRNLAAWPEPQALKSDTGRLSLYGYRPAPQYATARDFVHFRRGREMPRILRNCWINRRFSLDDTG
jgi:hypothetical protein